MRSFGFTARSAPNRVKTSFDEFLNGTPCCRPKRNGDSEIIHQAAEGSAHRSACRGEFLRASRLHAHPVRRYNLCPPMMAFCVYPPLVP